MEIAAIIGIDIRRGERNDRLGPPFERFAHSLCICFVKKLTLEPYLLSSEASRMSVKIKQKLCAKCQIGILNNFNVYTKNNLKSNDLQQLPM